MSDSEDQKFGLAGNEHDQGYEPMPMALPVEPTTALDVAEDLGTDHPTYKHLTRSEESEPIDRSYRDANTGAEIDDKYSVEKAQAASDLAKVRAEERQAREEQSNRDLADALSQLDARDQGQQPPVQQDQQPQPELDGIQPEATEAERDAAHAQVNAAWADADQKITEMLADPIVRERVEAEFNQVRQQAKTEVDGAWQQVEATKAAYLQHANNLTGQLNALILSNFPELQAVAGDQQQLAGAVQLLKQTNPQRAQQLADFALRASTLTGQLEQQGQAHRQAQAAQQEQALDQYTQAEMKRYEYWTAREVGDMKAVRENLQPILQKAYGIDANQLKAIHDGKIAIDGARLLRSAEFQAVMTDAIRYRLAQQGVTQARSNPIPKVQRPGVAPDGPKVHEGDLSAAASRFNLPGGNEGTQGLKNAAAWLTARRGRG